MLKKIFMILALAAIETTVYPEIAILPYRVNNPSVYFKQELGRDYSRLLAVGAVVKKDLEVISPRDLERDLEKFGINEESSITDEDLQMLGRSRDLDQILLGTISRSGKKYISSSLLYSVRDNRVMFRTRVTAGNLIDLAEREVKEAFLQYGTTPLPGEKQPLDLVFLIDTSYKMNHEWVNVKEAILHLAGTAMDSLRISTRAYIIPFSSKSGHQHGSAAVSSIFAIRKSLNGLSPAGGMSSENFFQSLRYAVESVRWRNNARKLMIIVTNSGLGTGGTNDKYGVIAGKKGIQINSIAMGSARGDDSEIVRRLSTITGGTYRDVSYHQKVYDIQGSALELYLEGGRFFQSRVSDGSWTDGILVQEKNYSGFGKPRSFLDEILYDEKKFTPDPASLPETFTGITGERIINRAPLESNIGEILSRILARNFGKSMQSAAPVGKALLSDGKISLWIQVHDRGMFDFLSEKSRNPYFFPLGVMISEDPAVTYGISLTPVAHKIPSDYIPDMIRADLSDVIRRRKYYMENGFFHPPLWFINVRVENMELLNKRKDIREE